MPDWRVHTVTEINNPYKENPIKNWHWIYMWIWTDKQIEWKDGKDNTFACHTFYPFTTLQVGDWIEVDFDETKLIGRWWNYPVNDNSPNVIRSSSIIKKFELPAEASSEMRQRAVEAQRNGTNEGEFIAAQGSVQNSNFSYERFIFNKYAGNFFYEKK